MHGAEQVATNLANVGRQVVRIQRANELIVVPSSQRVIGKIYRMRLEVFANLLAHLMLRTAIDDGRHVEQPCECVVVGVAKRAIDDGHWGCGALLLCDGNHNFTDIGVGFHMAVCFDNLVKREPRINDWSQHASIKIGQQCIGKGT